MSLWLSVKQVVCLTETSATIGILVIHNPTNPKQYSVSSYSVLQSIIFKLNWELQSKCASLCDKSQRCPLWDFKILFMGVSACCLCSSPIVAWSDVGEPKTEELLFACNFAIKARERYGKGLHGTHWVVVVQGENVISYSTKLHHDVVHCEKRKDALKKVFKLLGNSFLYFAGQHCDIKVNKNVRK